jgi:hypothetical protein
MNEPESPEEALAEGTLVSHLIELRQRILKAILVVIGVFLALVPFAQQIFLFLSHPVRERLPEGATLIATEVAAPRAIHRCARIAREGANHLQSSREGPTSKKIIFTVFPVAFPGLGTSRRWPAAHPQFV